MFGLMMDRPLLIAGLLEHAARFHGTTEIVSREADRSLVRLTYAAAEARAKQAAKALRRLGIGPGDRVGTLAWNTHRHFELYYAISGIGAVMHTINPRLFHEQIRYIVNHAQDQVLLVEPGFLPLVERLLPELETVRQIVHLGPAGGEPPGGLPGLVSYEALIAAESPELDWPVLDERSAASLCYTSGTTGNPKGVLYSHRSTVLHAMASVSADMLGMSATDVVCPVVPMFHVHAWGMPYSAPMVGAKLVLPGPHLDGASLCELFRGEDVTCSGGVPTLWLGALGHLAQAGGDFGSLKRVVIGGSAAPPAMIRAFEHRYGVRVLHAWGMTEMSPLGTVASYKAKHLKGTEGVREAVQASQGRPPFLVDLKIVDGEGRALPHDGRTVGELHVRGPWIAGAYYADGAATAAAYDAEGWFRTGDVCSIDGDGYVRITDRSKDVIKSGGEWISSIELENAAQGHPDIAEAAVIGVPHPRWGERPLLIVVAKPGCRIDKQAVLGFLEGQVAKWWLPDDVVTVDAIPHTATGKILKTRLREDFAAHRLGG